MAELPGAMPVTRPVLLTVATLVSLLSQISVGSAFEGETPAENCVVVP